MKSSEPDILCWKKTWVNYAIMFFLYQLQHFFSGMAQNFVQE